MQKVLWHPPQTPKWQHRKQFAQPSQSVCHNKKKLGAPSGTPQNFVGNWLGPLDSKIFSSSVVENSAATDAQPFMGQLEGAARQECVTWLVIPPT